MFDDVMRSWERWAESARGRRAMRRWACHDPALKGWPLSELRSPTSSARTDAMQASLVRHSQRGDAGAAATLTVQLRPGLARLVRLALASSTGISTRAEAEAEVLGVFGETLMQHPLTRRPTKIAANLLFDTRQQIWRAGGRAERAGAAAAELATTTRDHDPCSPYHPDSVADELDLVAAVGAALDRLAGTDASRHLTAELAYRAWILDQARTDISHDVGLPLRAVNTRLCRLRSIVRQTRSETNTGCQRPASRSR